MRKLNFVVGSIQRSSKNIVRNAWLYLPQCKDLSGHLYAILGVVSDAKSCPKPGYSKAIRLTGNLDTLNETTCRSSTRNHEMMNLPSCVPDWTSKQETHMLYS